MHAVCAKTGKDVCYWTEHSHTVTRGKTFNTELEGSNNNLTDGEAALAEGTFSDFSAFTFKSLTATGAEDKKTGGQKGRLALQDIGHGGSLTTNQWEEAQTMIIQTKTGFEQLIKQTKKCLGAISYDQTDSLYGLATLGCAERNPQWQGIHGQIQNSISNSTGMYMCVQCHAWLFLAKVVSWVQ